MSGDPNVYVTLGRVSLELQRVRGQRDALAAALQEVIHANAGCAWDPTCLVAHPSEPHEWCPGCIATAALSGPGSPT